MHHPLIEQKELRKMPDDKVQEEISELRKKRTMVIRTNNSPEVLMQIENLLGVYQLELAERSAIRIAKEKEKGTDHDDLINVE
ncbi:hypothetical protein CMI38_05510 [Candidatus Pacearchaeota archaeon]|jgi:hypothetical protein|nr:hypothetical protein [Candidatus Pacearchaeota archaeon]|tara:strand:- start:1960 stop:2208 length:249 start_codon:yes stop_codon:yes gene_type:complete